MDVGNLQKRWYICTNFLKAVIQHLSIRWYFLLVVMFLCSTTLYALPHQYEQFDNLSNMTQNLCVRSIAQTADGMMWLGTEDGLYSFNGYHLRKMEMRFADGQGEEERTLGCINCLVPDSDSLLIGCERGLLSFHLHTHTVRMLPYAKGENVRGILKAHGHWWVATAKAIYQDGTRLKWHQGEIFSIGSDDTHIYIGTQEKVMRYAFERKTFEAMMENVWIATCFITASPQEVWVGTARNVIAWQGEQETFRCTVPVAKSLCIDKQGNLLVGTDNGLYIIEKNKSIHHVLHDARVRESLSGDAVWSLFRDHDDNIWIGTNSGISMAVDNDLLATYTLPSITGESTGNQLFCIYSDGQDRLWMGGSNGLVCVEHLGGDQQKVRWYRIDNEHFPIPHNRIRAILSDSQHRLWVGGDGGLFLLNERTGQLERYAIEEESHHWVYDIEEGKNGNLIVTTFDATYVVKFDSTHECLDVIRKTEPKNLHARKQEMASLLSQYGLPDLYLSAYKDPHKGVLLLGGTDRFSILHTNKLRKTAVPATLQVTDILVNGIRHICPSDITFKSCTFEPHENIQQFFLTDFDYADERPDNYSYRITGQNEWVDIQTTDRSITFTNLSAGSYQLYIRQGNQEGNQTELTPVFTFTIEASWYATTWAGILYFLLLTGLLYGIYRFVEQRKRLLQERKERAELLARAKEKEKELLSDNEYLAGQLRLQLMEKSGDQGEFSADEKFLLDITRIIEENMDDSELNVNTLSEKSGISTKQLYRRIKSLTGMTTVAYIRDQRMKKAASLLAKGSFTVSEVMYMVGFSSASYFTRCFCEEYGMPPSEYKV